MIQHLHQTVKLRVFIFVLSIATIHGGSFGIADNYEHMTNTDVQTYMGLADFDFDQSPTRRYRVIVPTLAAGVHLVFGKLMSAMQPDSFPGDFSMVMSFVVVNTLIFGLLGIVLFMLIQLYVRDNILAAVVAVISIYSGRWILFLAGTPLVDSLYILTVAMLVYGILNKKVMWIISSIYLGVWAKEAFVFFLPLLIFTPKKQWLRYILHIAFSAVVIFLFRYWVDQKIGAGITDSIVNDINHIDSIPMSIRRLFSVHGVYELFSVAGFWNIFILIGILNRWYKHVLDQRYFWLVFLAMIFVQAMLSTELARMFLLAAPLISILIAVSVDRLYQLFYQNKIVK